MWFSSALSETIKSSPVLRPPQVIQKEATVAITQSSHINSLSVSPNWWGLLSKPMVSITPKAMTGTWCGASHPLNPISMMVWTSIRRSTISLVPTKLHEKINFAWTFSECKKSLEEKHSTSSLKLSFCLTSSLTFSVSSTKKRIRKVENPYGLWSHTRGVRVRESTWSMT